VNPTLDAAQKAISLLEVCDSFDEADSVALAGVISAQRRACTSEECYWASVRLAMNTFGVVPAEKIDDPQLWN
jgi:hypothetical protein